MKKLLLLLIVSTSMIFAMTATELAKKMDKKVTGFNSTVSELKMVLIQSNGDKNERLMLLKTLEKGDQSKALIEFLSPSDVKGTKLLTYVHANKDNDQWLYLPALKRVKRIVGKNKKGSFMGSEFSYEDFGKQGSDVYTYDETLTDITLDGVACFKGTRYPKDKDSSYAKQDIYVDKATYLVKQVDYYDKKNRLEKIAYFSDYKQFDTLYRVGKIIMTNKQNNKSTIITWGKDKIFAKLKDKDFHKRVLKR